MSREIELKIPLTKAQFSQIEDFLLGRTKIAFLSVREVSKIFKNDEYFSLYKTHEERLKNKELRVIRIRTIRCAEKSIQVSQGEIKILGDKPQSGDKSYFCIKQKTLQNGVEFNSEHETFVEQPEVLRAFFAATGYSKWFEKTKDALSALVSLAGFEAHLELEKVNELPYAEIEYTKDDLAPDEVRSSLEKILTALGLDPKKRDSRSWSEILESGNLKTEN